MIFHLMVIFLSLEELVDSTLMWDLPPRRRFDPFDKNFVPRIPVYEPLNIQNVHHNYHDYHHVQTQSPNYPPPNPPQPAISPPSQWKIGTIFQKGIEGLTSSAASFLPQTLSSITPQIHRPPRPPTDPTTSQIQQEPSKHQNFFSSFYNKKPAETTTMVYQVGHIENHEEIPAASSSHFNYPSINYHPHHKIPLNPLSQLESPYYTKVEKYPKREEVDKKKKKGQYTEQRRKEPQMQSEIYPPALYSPDIEGEDEITWAEFLRAVTSSPNGAGKRNNYPSPTRRQWRCFVEGARPKGGIRSKEEAAMALAQILFESNGLTSKKEEICIKSTMNNCKPLKKKMMDKDCDASGKKYYGRGYLNLRGCSNYRAASVDLYNSERLVHDPDLLTRDEETAWDVSLWQWRTKVRVGKGVVDEGHFGATTAALVGSNGCKSRAEQGPRKRFKIYGIVRNAFGLSGKGNEEGCFKPYNKTKKKHLSIFPDFAI